ncbi:primase-helicase family protein [Methylocella sp.]|uniref:primase-helicase family protein n=1 Tax=Methylocella sp. TaxID=1978226 RepID=UPI0035B3C633
MSDPSEIVAAVEGAEILEFRPKAALSAQAEGGAPPPPDEPPPPEPPAGGEGDDGAGGLVDVMNREFAFVLMGSRAVILRERHDGPAEDRIRILGLDAFRSYHFNKVYKLRRRVRGEDGEWTEKISYVKWAPTWLNSKHRRTYDGVEFFPDPGNAPGTPGYFNLWRGFSVAPSAEPPEERAKRYAVFLDHLKTNICNGDREVFAWVWAWLAHMVQRPRERVGTALCLRGKMGTGKTKVGEVVGSLFASHYFLVDDPRYVTGQFNAHMASCLLLQVDEGFWAGDKAAEGRLKGLVTAPKQMIEAKGVDPIRLDNYVRLLFSSNEDWVVPAGMDERRFCVLDVAPHAAQNHEYFAEMDAQLGAGGREALLADLLAFDLDAAGAPNLRVIPKTGALLEQKIRSMDPVTSWWFERLCDGAPTRRGGEWRRRVPVDTLFDDFVHMAEKIGVRRKAESTSFGMRMRKLVPGLINKKITVYVDLPSGGSEPRRVRGFALPPLAECRSLFCALVGQDVPWGEFGEEESDQGGEGGVAPPVDEDARF